MSGQDISTLDDLSIWLKKQGGPALPEINASDSAVGQLWQLTLDKAACQFDQATQTVELVTSPHVLLGKQVGGTSAQITVRLMLNSTKLYTDLKALLKGIG